MTRSSRGRLFLGWWVSFCGGKKQLKTTKQAASLFDGNPGVSLFSLAWIGLDFSMIRKTEKNPNEPTWPPSNNTCRDRGRGPWGLLDAIVLELRLSPGEPSSLKSLFQPRLQGPLCRARPEVSSALSPPYASPLPLVLSCRGPFPPARPGPGVRSPARSGLKLKLLARVWPGYPSLSHCQFGKESFLRVDWREAEAWSLHLILSFVLL